MISRYLPAPQRLRVALPTRINGLPAHVLLIHVVIAAVPLAALLLVASATWPAARARLGVVTPLVALVALVLVPITTNAGHWLKNHLGFTNARVERHAALGGELLPWTAGVFVLAVAVWVLGRRYEMAWRGTRGEAALPVWVGAALAVLSVAVAVGTVIQLYRIGDSGAQAVWHGVGTGTR